MPIERPRLRSRMRVAWFDATPPDEAKRIFEERELLVSSCTDADLQDPAYLAGLSAVVFTQRPDKPLQIGSGLKKHAVRLLDYDCRIILRPALDQVSIITNVVDELKLPTAGLPPQEAAKLEKWQPAKAGDPPPPYARIFHETVPWNNVANFLLAGPPGNAPASTSSLKLKVDERDDAGRTHDFKLPSESEILIRRAFWDCADVHLVPMALGDGRSGVPVYRAYAELQPGHAKGQIGMWPQPYFVKIGSRRKIFEEYENYEDNVDPYLPFHLGPHLVHERCCLGAHEGVIVGDYVEESESLRDSARKGCAAAAIACLFDRTLLGWYRHASEIQVPLSERLLASFPRPRKIDPSRFARARELGATRDVSQLRDLFQRCDSVPVLVGPIHGDLHSANVRVRATDAIAIDFGAHCTFPLVYDAACLEASLLVEGFGDDQRDIQEWLTSLEPLYDISPLNPLRPTNPKNRSSWFHACVRQIRHYARQWERGKLQYAGALAVALLVKASKDKDATEPEASRRAAAYVLAERVLSLNFGSQPTASVNVAAS
jgi:hypothetical protein